MFDDLQRVLRLRQNDHLVLRTTVRKADDSFDNVSKKVEGLEAAIAGNRNDDDQDTFLPRGHTRLMPPLKSSLKEHLMTALAEIEAEAVDLHKSIQLNGFRSSRNDPRARSEQELATRRNDTYAKWNKLLDDLDDEVLDFWMEEKRSARLRSHGVGALRI